MKVCERHISELKRGMTYQRVPSKDCEICKAIDKVIKKYEWCGIC